MTKLYLIKSEIDRKKTGDVIIDLDKVFTYKIAKDEKEYILVLDYTQADSVKACFKTEEAVKKELTNIFIALGQDTSIVNELIPFEIENKLDKLQKIMKIKEMLNAD